jgi:hypothetical protein
VRTSKEVVENRFLVTIAAVWAVWCFGFFDSVEDRVERDMTCAELCEDASLVATQLADDVEVVVRGEGVVDLV